MHVVSALDVLLRAQALDPQVVPPALEAEGPPLDAPHGVVARQQRHLRVADAGVLVRVAAVRRRGRRGKEGITRKKRKKSELKSVKSVVSYDRLLPDVDTKYMIPAKSIRYKGATSYRLVQGR